MLNPIEHKVNEWAKHNEEFREINLKIIHLEKRLFFDYLPSQSPNPDFFVRLKKWLENAKLEKDQKLLFQIIPELFYVGEEEFSALYRTAYNVEVARWAIDLVALEFDDLKADEKLQDAIRNTWFCSATDSFIINDFFKINNIPSKFDLRPDWHSLTQLGDEKRILDYINNQGISRIVLLEDFVGSGDQVKSRIEFICKNFPLVNVLFISLITCPKGIDNLNELELVYSKLTVKHIIHLSIPQFITEDPLPAENAIHTKIREMAEELYLVTTNGQLPGPKPYCSLGYKKLVL